MGLIYLFVVPLLVGIWMVPLIFMGETAMWVVSALMVVAGFAYLAWEGIRARRDSNRHR